MALARDTQTSGRAHQVRSASFLEHFGPSVHGRCFFFSSIHWLRLQFTWPTREASRRHLKNLKSSQ
jgi:hypothetical protein